MVILGKLIYFCLVHLKETEQDQRKTQLKFNVFECTLNSFNFVGVSVLQALHFINCILPSCPKQLKIQLMWEWKDVH